MTLYMLDAAYPPATANLPGALGTASAVGGYLGGNTPHAWSAVEWARFSALGKLPIWVYDSDEPGFPGATTHGLAAAVALSRLRVPKGVPVAVDMEAPYVDADFVDGFTEIMNWAGYWCIVYGSVANVFSNPVRGGYWVADWPPAGQPAVPHQYAHNGVVATQFGSWATMDVSVITSTLLGQLWH